MLCDQRGIAPPQADVVPLQCEIACCGKRSVATAQHRDLHEFSLVRVSNCFNMKCCTLPRAVRGKSSTKTMSRGALNRASCVCTCALRLSASTRHPERLIT